MPKGNVVVILMRWASILALFCGACVTSKEYKPPPSAPPQLRLPRNDVYEGSVLTGKLSPRFVWEAPATDSAAFTYELQYSPDSKFESDVTSVETAELSHQPDAPLPVSTVPPVGRRYYWRVRACISDVCSEFSKPWWINLGRSAKDFNGDGYADVAVGEPLFFNGSGRVHIFFGGPGSTFDTVKDGVITNPGTSMGFGRKLSQARDFNNDGFADLMVGAVDSAFLYFGAAGSTFEGSRYIALTGSTNESFGESLAAVGDLNADGYSDVAVGSPTNSARGANAGRVYVFFGGAPGSPSEVINGDLAGQNFGAHISGADMDGDGLSDLLVTSGAFTDEFHAAPCSARLFPGLSQGAISSGMTHDFIGERSLVCSFRAVLAGDLNRDGFADIVGAINAGPARMLVFPGGSKFPEQPTQTSVVGTGVGFSSWMSAVGDVNGDGFDDVALTGEYGGEIYLGTSSATEPIFAAAGGNSLYGQMAQAGDVNGDGFDDVMITLNSVLFFFGTTGRAFNTSPDGTISSPVTGTDFGRSIAKL